MSDRGTWKITVGGSTLADYTDILRADAVAGGKVFQSEPIFRGDAIAHSDRGNRAIARRFVLVREYSSAADAATWYMTGAHGFEGVADVAIYHKDTSGTESRWDIADAKVEVTVEEPLAYSTTTHITITGGLPVLYVAP